MNFMPKLLGYSHTYSTVYHPHSNEIVEHFNDTYIPKLPKLEDHEKKN